jgi:hypothetical protein
MTTPPGRKLRLLGAVLTAVGLLLPLVLLLGPVGLSAAGAEEGPTGPSGTSDGSDEEVTTTTASTVTTDADVDDDVDIDDDESDAETSVDLTAEAGSDEGADVTTDVDVTTDAEGEVVGTLTGSIAVDAAVCAGTKVDFGSLPTTIEGIAITVVDSGTVHFDIPDGATVEVCVKAGSTEAGEGPENLTLTADAAVGHSSGKELSHVSVIGVTTGTTTTGTTTTQTTTPPVGTGRIVIEKDTDPEDVSTEFSFTGAISASLQDDESAGVDVRQVRTSSRRSPSRAGPLRPSTAPTPTARGLGTPRRSWSIPARR